MKKLFFGVMAVVLAIGLALPTARAAPANAACPTCDGTVIEVNQNVTVDLNTNPPTYTGDPDLKPYFSYTKVGPADNWTAIFDVGAKKLLVKDGATITVNWVGCPGGNNECSPGIEIRGTCDLEIENGGHIVVESLNKQAGDIFIQMDGNITINGEVRNEVKGTNGMPGKITIASCCGNITEGTTGRILDLGIDPGGNEINIVTCCGCEPGDIIISGLVMARAHAHAEQTEETRPRIRVASFTGAVTINANTVEPLLDEYNPGALYDLWGGLLSWVTTNYMPGSVKVQALKDITVNGHGADPTGRVSTSFAAIATVAATASTAQGGTVDVRSLQGSIIGNDRAFQVYRGTANALIRLWAAQDILLNRPGATATFNPVVDVSGFGTGSPGGGTNEIRAFQGGITVGTNALVSATGTTAANNGTNKLTYCTGFTNNGTVNPSPVSSSDCTVNNPPLLFTDCKTDFGVVCECPPCGEVCCWWCNKGAVLSQVEQNMGNRCAIPDIFVDVRLPLTDPILPTEIGTGQPATGSIQAAIDYVNLHGDPSPIATPGEIFIGVNATNCDNKTAECDCLESRPLAGDTPFGTENVVITNTHTQRLNVFGCSVSLHAADPSKPVITIEGSDGKVTVMDIHVSGSHVAGYLIQDNDDLVVVKNSRSFGASGIGYWVKDDDVEITGSAEISGNAIGILVEGNNVKLRTNKDIDDNGIGIKIIGDNNESNASEVGDNGRPNGTGILVEGKGNLLHGDNVIYNTTDGIVIAGSGTSLANGNFVTDEDTQYNGDDGIVVSGSYNTLDRNKQVKFNSGDGIEVGGNMNLLNENVAGENGGHGISVAGNANSLVKNEAVENGGDGIHVTGDNNGLDENTAEDNTLNGIKADSSDGASGNNLEKNEGNKNTLQGIRACGQNDLLENKGEDNGVFPEVVFVCSSAAAKFFVADSSDDQVYKYDASGAILSRFDLNSNNGDASGVAVVGSDVYVLDKGDKQVYKYNSAGTFDKVSKTLKELGGGSLSGPSGLAIAGDDMWVVDASKKKNYRYSLASAFPAGGNLNAAQEIALNSNNGDAQGLAIDGTYLYVLDKGDKQFYRYQRDGLGTVAISKTLGSLSSGYGATLDGTSFLWVVDTGNDDMAYKYDLTGGFPTGSGTWNASSQFSLQSDNADPSGL